MIELIFVIIIIGILASMAIPRMSATRDNAKISSEVSNAKTCLTDAQSYYLARNSLIGFATPACNAAMLAGNTVRATVLTTVGSESITIIGVPAMLDATINLNGTYNNFKGKLVTY